VESAAIGLLAGRFAAAERHAEAAHPPAADHRPWRASSPTSPAATSKQRIPVRARISRVNVNFGLFPPLTQAVKRDGGGRLRGDGEKRWPRNARSPPARWSTSSVGSAGDHAAAAE